MSIVSRNNPVEGLGAAHGSDLADAYGAGPLGDYVIRFIATHNPNGGDSPKWPTYTQKAPRLLTFEEGGAIDITLDTFRAEQMAYLTKLNLAYPQ